MQRLYFFLPVFLFGIFCHAQDCQIEISGYVLDRATREPLEFSSIGILELGTGTIADSTGYFQLTSLCGGDYHIQVNHLGCTPVKSFISLQRDTTVYFLLDHHEEFLNEVIVEGKEVDSKESHSRQVISTIQIKNQ